MQQDLHALEVRRRQYVQNALSSGFEAGTANLHADRQDVLRAKPLTIRLADLWIAFSVSQREDAERSDDLVRGRFVTLIAALYENKVKLICSADVPPERLYINGKGAFEFKRLVSRLKEMQSVDYLALAHGRVE